MKTDTKNEILQFRLPDDLRRDLERAAEADERSMSAFIRAAIKERIQAMERVQKLPRARRQRREESQAA